MAVAREPAPLASAGTERRRAFDRSGARPRRRLPARFAFALLANNFAQAMMLTLPFTLATYMVRDWLRASSSPTEPAGAAAATADAAAGPAAIPAPDAIPPAPARPPVDERRVGELTGALTAAYSLAQAVTSIPFGRWSDAHGRRPVLLLGAAASAVSVALFGLAGSLGPALLARAAGGALNAFIGAWKTSLAEAAAGDEQEQARVMSLMGLAWGVGCVLGPGAGGLLARPCDRPSLRAALAPLGGCERAGGGGGPGGGGGGWVGGWGGGGGGGGGLFDARPYALPCLVVAGVCAASGMLMWFWVPETLGLGEEGLLLPAEDGEEEQEQELERGGAAAAAAWAAGGGGGGADEEQARGQGGLAARKSDRSPLLPMPPSPVRDALCVVVTVADDAGKAATAATAATAAAATAAGCQRRPRSAAGLPPPPPPPPSQPLPNHTARRHGGRGSLELQPTPSFSKFKRLPYTGGGGSAEEGEDDGGRDGIIGCDGGEDDEDGDALLLGAPPPSAAADAAAGAPPPFPSAAAAAEAPGKTHKIPWDRCPYVRHALAGYCAICLHFIALEELVPLWASSPLSSGGLARA